MICPKCWDRMRVVNSRVFDHEAAEYEPATPTYVGGVGPNTRLGTSRGDVPPVSNPGWMDIPKRIRDTMQVGQVWRRRHCSCGHRVDTIESVVDAAAPTS